MSYKVGTKIQTPQGICVISEIPNDGTSSIKLSGVHNFWCASYELKAWLAKDWRIIDTPPDRPSPD